jgi:hypothetical protein
MLPIAPLTGSQSQTIVITRTGRGSQRIVNENLPYRDAFVAFVLSVSFGLGFVLVLLTVVILHHWQRWGYAALVIFAAVTTGVISWFGLHVELPNLLAWGTPYVLAHTATFLVGGLLGIYLGRPLARGIVTLLLPPRLRQVLAFLWLVDGKQPPGVSPGAAKA